MGFPTYELYQMKTDPEQDEWLFQELSVLTEKGYFPSVVDYKLVFAARQKPGTVPKGIYATLADLARKTHKFRCINTGDVLVLRQEAIVSSFFLEHGEAIPFEGFFAGPNDSGQPLTPETEHYVIAGYPDTWQVIDTRKVEDQWFFLMQNEKLGADASWIVLDVKGRIADAENRNSFDDATVQKLIRYVHTVNRTPPAKEKPEPTPQPRRRLEVSEQYRENGEYLRAASSEVGEEQNYNMIDGTPNNAKKKRHRRRSVRARLREKQQLLHGGQPEKNRVLEKP